MSVNVRKKEFKRNIIFICDTYFFKDIQICHSTLSGIYIISYNIDNGLKVLY